MGPDQGQDDMNMWPLVVIAAIAALSFAGWQTRANDRALAEACIAAGKEWRPANDWMTSYVCAAPLNDKDETP